MLLNQLKFKCDESDACRPVKPNKDETEKEKLSLLRKEFNPILAKFRAIFMGFGEK